MIAPASRPDRPPAFIGRAPRVYDAIIAKQLGISAAAALQQLVWCIHNSGQYIDDLWWVRLSLQQILSGLMHKDSESTLKRALTKLKALNLILTRTDLNERADDRTPWYAVNEQHLYHTFWPPSPPAPPGANPEQQRQQVKMNPPLEPEINMNPPFEPDPKQQHQQVKMNPPLEPEVNLTWPVDTESQAMAPTGQNERGFKMTPLLREKKDKERSRSDSECRTREAPPASASSVQTEIDTDCDTPQPETSDFLIHLDLRQGENDYDPDCAEGDEPPFASPEPDPEPMAMASGDDLVPNDIWTRQAQLRRPTAPPKAPVPAERCIHPDRAIHPISAIPGNTFYCRECQNTVIDSVVQQPKVARPRQRQPPWKPKDACEPTPSYHRLFGKTPQPEWQPASSCPRNHSRLHAVYEGAEVIACKLCNWSLQHEGSSY